MRTLKIGLIGCGKQADKHINGLSKIGGVDLVLADIEPRAAQSLAESKGLSWTADIDSLYDDKDLAAVDICTPTPSHRDLVMRAIDAGKDFICEKPLCETSAQAREIADAMERSDLIGMVGFTYRFAPVFITAKRLLEGVEQDGKSEALGRILSCSFRIGGRGSHQVWKHRKATAGGAITEMLCHMLDLAFWYFGPAAETLLLVSDLRQPRRVIQGREEEVDAEDYVVARMRSQSGVEILFQADMITPAFTQLMEVQGENGTLVGSIQPENPSFVFCKTAADGYPAGRTDLTVHATNLFETQMADFVSSVRERAMPTGSTATDSVMVLEAIERLRRE